MQELPASLIGGTIGIILGLIFGGLNLSDRLQRLRQLIEAGVKDPAKTNWNDVAAEVQGIERDARSFVALFRRLVGR